MPPEPVNVFLGPPYQEIKKHFDAIAWLVKGLQDRLVLGSVLVLQSDDHFHAELLPDPEHWDVRHYGRTQLAVWVATQPSAPSDRADEVAQPTADSVWPTADSREPKADHD